MTSRKLLKLLEQGVPLNSIAATLLSEKRWKGKSPSERSANASKAGRARLVRMTPQERREVARLGGLARAKALRQKRCKKET